MEQFPTKKEVVSLENESLILVDSSDRELGFLEKHKCHDGLGKLHRAFSVFIFNSSKELLIHQRARSKRLWPNYWTNSCCSHPRQGEPIHDALSRRLSEELGLKSTLKFIYKFEYQETYKNKGAEHELCHVYAGQTEKEPIINVTEIQDYRWILPEDLLKEIKQNSEIFTPWFLMELDRVLDDYLPIIAKKKGPKFAEETAN